MNQNKNNYKCCTSWNNDNCAWGFHWKYVHDEWKNKQGHKSSVRFANPTTNERIYISYLMNTSEDSKKEEEKDEDDSQDTDLIPLSRFELLKWLIKIFYFPLMLIFTI